MGRHEDAGRIYGGACGREIQGDGRLAAGKWLQAKRWARALELLQQRGGEKEREREITEQQSLSAAGRCLRQSRHTPLIILQPNTKPLDACLYECVVVCVVSQAVLEIRKQLAGESEVEMVV